MTKHTDDNALRRKCFTNHSIDNQSRLQIVRKQNHRNNVEVINNFTRLYIILTRNISVLKERLIYDTFKIFGQLWGWHFSLRLLLVLPISAFGSVIIISGRGNYLKYNHVAYKVFRNPIGHHPARSRTQPFTQSD